MLKTEMVEELKRLRAIVPNAFDEEDARQREALIEELHRKFGAVLLARWREVITYVIDTHKHRSLPTVSDFSSALTAIHKQSGAPMAIRCISCKGSGFVYAWYRYTGLDTPVLAMKPCPICGRLGAVNLKWEAIPEPDNAAEIHCKGTCGVHSKMA